MSGTEKYWKKMRGEQGNTPKKKTRGPAFYNTGPGRLSKKAQNDSKKKKNKKRKKKKISPRRRERRAKTKGLKKHEQGGVQKGKMEPN